MIAKSPISTVHEIIFADHVKPNAPYNGAATPAFGGSHIGDMPKLIGQLAHHAGAGRPAISKCSGLAIDKLMVEQLPERPNMAELGSPNQVRRLFIRHH